MFAAVQLFVISSENWQNKLSNIFQRFRKDLLRLKTIPRSTAVPHRPVARLGIEGRRDIFQAEPDMFVTLSKRLLKNVLGGPEFFYGAATPFAPPLGYGPDASTTIRYNVLIIHVYNFFPFHDNYYRVHFCVACIFVLSPSKPSDIIKRMCLLTLNLIIMAAINKPNVHNVSPKIWIKAARIFMFSLDFDECGFAVPWECPCPPPPGSTKIIPILNNQLRY